MRIIETKKDIVNLLRAEVPPSAFLIHVEDYFNQLRTELEDEAENQFNFSENGFIVLLEMGDNVRDLKSAGLADESGGLLGSYPEYFETLDMGDCQGRTKWC
ncbi:hypothetical protein DFP94_102119 [Fontibacillus phaseoli]|uniref:Uncharacterized protein n=1 Tax=Fontibacillus phaseoli TaxID=1416533 RepID=A0A369BJ02_9BACL|nr:hypothetical protein [Fontibacillus phaseoli]RCX21371.1 hypothetical protein DFP94_102119 [Fontibacillus phaseoli]